ncbi:TPA: hypothetical protein EYG96_03130 [Candidatus Gracilibacteria bacterium]|nr:hypothetical protein [Candidatus Peregrinibacteria bacterium]HIQ57007.1 hypothetical protein [Candidatus Gracilibacteria bacterium]HIQ57777.1 hypothetical protein [Candidatus Gracilibacteria bacterium]
MIKITISNPAGLSILKHIYSKFPHADFEYTCDFSANKNIQESDIKNVLEKASNITRFGRIGIVCETHEEEIQINNYISKKNTSNKNIFIAKALPLLKPLIEENWEKKPETKSIIRKYLLPLKSNNIDTLILFSPYFDILEKEFQKKMGKNCVIISASEIQAENIMKNTAEILCNNNKQFFVNTDLYTSEKFKHIAQKFFCEGISEKSIQVI